MAKDGGYHIVELAAENVMRLKAIRIRPEGNAVTLEGRNKVGKTSIMRCISMVIGGEKLCPERPIRDGEDSARIDADLGEFKVTRNWTSNEKSYLRIEHKDHKGHPIASPQVFLNKLLGRLAFDPMEFSRMDAPKRAELLRKIAGLDFSAEQEARDTAYSERRDLKRDLDKVKKQIGGLGDVPEIKTVRPTEEVQSDYDEQKAYNDQIGEAAQSVKLEQETIRTAKANIADYQKSITEWNAKMGEAQTRQDAATRRAAIKPKDMTKISAELDAAREAGSAVFKIEQKTKLDRERKRLEKSVAARDKAITDADESKAEKLRASNMPIEGLGVGEEDVTYNGLPFGQASHAEQTRVAMAIGMAENPKLRVILINDGSLCDQETLAEVKRIAEENDYQVWIERVADAKRKGKGDGSVYYIEDGEVR